MFAQDHVNFIDKLSSSLSSCHFAEDEELLSSLLRLCEKVYHRTSTLTRQNKEGRYHRTTTLTRQNKKRCNNAKKFQLKVVKPLFCLLYTLYRNISVINNSLCKFFTLAKLVIILQTKNRNKILTKNKPL